MLGGSLLDVLPVKLAAAQDSGHREQAGEQEGADQPPVIGDAPHVTSSTPVRSYLSRGSRTQRDINRR